MIRCWLPMLLALALLAQVQVAQAQVAAMIEVPSQAGVDLSGQRATNPAISRDGRYVALEYRSSLDEPVGVYLYDHRAGQVQLLSAGLNGADADGDSGEPAISADGRYVVFVSAANNLVANDRNNGNDVFLYDRQISSLTRITASFDDAEWPPAPSVGSPAIAADGGTIAYDGFFGPGYEIFVYELASGLTTPLFERCDDCISESWTLYPSLSAGGRYVAFVSDRADLVEGDNNGDNDAFILDRQSGELSRVSVNSSGVEGNASSGYAVVSANGRYVAFYSEASNLVVGDDNGRGDVFVSDRQEGTTEIVSVSNEWESGNHDSTLQSISADGRFVVFSSEATNLVENDRNRSEDIYVHDRRSGKTLRVSENSKGQAGSKTTVMGSSSGPAEISPDGRYIVFQSKADNLLPGTQGFYNVFIAHNPLF